jgi:branched-chain amino acid transport system ATP-binding protein
MISIDNVNVYYAKNRVLKDLSISINEGEVVALIGSNAAGKTTTLRTLMGLKNPTSGTLRFGGDDLARVPTHQRVARGMVMVPEGRQVFVKFSVMENLRMGAYHRRDRNSVGRDLDYVFGVFPKLAARRTQRAGLMSGGEQQMLAIGRGLMAKPRFLLLDEPTLGLAPIIVEEISKVVRALAESGMTILLAEQNAAMALSCAGRAYVLESGSISLQGEAAELRQTDAIKSLYLGY